MKPTKVAVVWDKNGKYFQTWEETYNDNDGISHGERIAEKIGGFCQIVEFRENTNAL